MEWYQREEREGEEDTIAAMALNSSQEEGRGVCLLPLPLLHPFLLFSPPLE